MSKIPDFESKPDYPFGVLPDGVFPCEQATLRERFVEQFPDSQRRTLLCDGFFLLRSEAAKVGIAATQWVDGSFVESKLNPEDVDVVSFVDYDTLNGLPTQSQDRVEELLNGLEATKVDYQCHTFLVPSCPVGHPYHGEFQNIRRFWRNWWGKTRNIRHSTGVELPGYRKGFVEMTLGKATLAPQISPERE
jgi:hypothetical protein